MVISFELDHTFIISVSDPFRFEDPDPFFFPWTWFNFLKILNEPTFFIFSWYRSILGRYNLPVIWFGFPNVFGSNQFVCRKRPRVSKPDVPVKKFKLDFRHNRGVGHVLTLGQVTEMTTDDSNKYPLQMFYLSLARFIWVIFSWVAGIL